MISSMDDSIPEDPVGAALDNEIASLQSQSKHAFPLPMPLLTLAVSALKAQRKLQASTILSSHATASILSKLRASQKTLPSQSSQATNLEIDTTPLLATSNAQQSHNQTNLYRACASITTFRIRDPDPSAVDNGHVLGIRFDVSSSGKFVKPYHVMLNKPFEGSELLRIHRHTIPPCIPLASLADRYLPHGKGAVATGRGESSAGSKRQDLRKFTRALRREITAYHNRISTIKSLRKEFRLDEKPSKKGKDREKVIADISAADAEAKQVRIEWIDGRIGRALVGEKGEVLKCVIIGEDGRDRETEGRVLGDGNAGMVGIGERLREGIY
jgi:central kinetochore subunit Mal2/MCM21